MPSSSNLDVELPPSRRFGPLFACLDDKAVLKENPKLAFNPVIFDACTKSGERNAYIVKLLRECLSPETFKAWDKERNEFLSTNVHKPIKRKQ